MEPHLTKASSPLRWGVEQRLEFIEFRLFWDGAINRSDLMDFFGVSVPQASKDLSLYQEKAPGNMEYDKSGKRYLAATRFKPRFLTPAADEYLSQLQAICDNTLSIESAWLATVPETGSLPIPHRRVKTELLRMVLAAIKEESSLEILYQSMSTSRTEPAWRGISPHALGNDGFRWHARAFCHIDHKFKDFLLSRCLDCKPGEIALADGKDDRFWHEHLEIVLTPNPGLSESQQQVIALDYGMDNNERVLSVRKSLLYYFQKRLRLDVAGALDNPRETPVVIANREEFDQALKEAST